MREALRPAVLAAQRPRETKLPRRQAHAQLHHQSTHHRLRQHVAADDGDAGPRRHDDRRSLEACGARTQGDRLRIIAAAGHPHLAGIRTGAHDDDLPAPRDGSPDLPVARDEGGDVRMPRPPPRALGVVSLADLPRDADAREPSGRLGAATIAPSAPRTVEHRRTGDEGAEGGEPEREHRPGHEPQRDRPDHGDDRGEQRHRRARRGRPRCGQLEGLRRRGRGRSEHRSAGSRRRGESRGHPPSQAPAIRGRGRAPTMSRTVPRPRQAGEESTIGAVSRPASAAECTETSSTMIVMLSRPPFSSAASIIAATASAGSAFSARKCWMP